MTEETKSVKRQIEATGRAEILLERNDFLIVKWSIPQDGGVTVKYSFEAFAYAASGMGNNYPWSREITGEQALYFLDNIDEAEEYFRSKHHYFHTEIREVGFDDIRSVDKDGVRFKDGHFVSWRECAANFKRRYPGSERGVGERDVTAEPPYIELFGVYAHDRILFDGKGILAKKRNADNFRRLQALILEFGYTTLDLS